MNLKEMAEGQGLTREEFVEIVDLLVDTTRTDIHKIRSALAAGDLQAVAEAAHSIKGAAGNMGFMNLSAVARDVESQATGEKAEALQATIDDLISQLRIVETSLEKELP